VAVVLASGLTACGSKSDANAKNFGAAIEQHLAERGRLCLGMLNWPVVLKVEDGKPVPGPFMREVPTRMAALQAAGLVKAEALEVDDPFSVGREGGRKVPAIRYTLAEAAGPFLQEPVSRPAWTKDTKPMDLCWGRKSVDKVVKWTGPIAMGEYQAARVEYTYRIVDLAPWAQRPDIQQAFDSVKEAFDGVGTKPQARRVQLTSEGWEPERSLFD
jgi:hypothetical protein